MFSLVLDQRLISNIISSSDCAYEKMQIISSLNVVNTTILGGICKCVNQFGIQIDLCFLTRGNQNLTYEDNCLMFREVYKFIRSSKQFLIM